jgi:hypothetical protein
MTTEGTPDRGTSTEEAVRRPDDGPRIRVSDADRSATVEVLQDAVARGLLTHDEGGERIAAAYAARFREDLAALTADLPPAASPVAATAVGWRHLGSALVAQVRHDARATVTAGPRSRRLVLTVLVAVLLLCILVALGGLAIHGLFDGGFEHDFGVESH